MINYFKKNIGGYIFLISLFIGMYIHQTYSHQKPVVKFDNESLPDKGYLKYNETIWGVKWVKCAMQPNSDPNEMKLYLTKDLQLIWVSNIVADKLGRVRAPHVTTEQDYVKYYLTIEKPYVEIISYSNVDFNNIKKKQKKNISIIVQEFFAYKTSWVFKDTYKEIMDKKFTTDQVKDFSLDDVSILKKGNNICITFDEETINPYYELETIDQELDVRGIPSKARKTLLEVNRPKLN